MHDARDIVREQVFSLRDVVYRFGRRHAVMCPALDVLAGECVAFLGGNGSGKTTLLKLMNGLIGPFAGTILFFGAPLPGAPALRRRSVFVHQQPVLFVGTVRENLGYPLKLRRFDSAATAARVDAAAESLGIAALLDRPAQGLSGGEVQRVAVGRALVLGADVLLLDEPTASMDAASREAVAEVLLVLKERGHTLVVSTHDELLAKRIADRCVLFGADRVAAVQKARPVLDGEGGGA